jgi:hypothetical protein
VSWTLRGDQLSGSCEPGGGVQRIERSKPKPPCLLVRPLHDLVQRYCPLQDGGEERLIEICFCLLSVEESLKQDFETDEITRSKRATSIGQDGESGRTNRIRSPGGSDQYA